MYLTYGLKDIFNLYLLGRSSLLERGPELEGRDIMPLWRIHPVAHPGDSYWQGRRIWAEVIVRAESAAFARLIASKLDEPPVPHRLGNESLCFRSGFEDEKLYWVRRLGAADAARYETASERDGVIVAVPLADGAGEAETVKNCRESRLNPYLAPARELEGSERAANPSADLQNLPGSDLDVARMPGHWLLARLGKRVLRPGGLGITRALLDALAIGSNDDVVEFAPGLGTTAHMILDRRPRRYTGVERDSKAAHWTKRHLPQQPNVSVVVGAADQTDLPAGSASVVLGEAMLSMNTQAHKERIVAEAFRLLRPGGRYGIHELCVVPDDMPPDRKDEIDRTLSSVIHVGARPLPTPEWRALLEAAGFEVLHAGYAPMHLLRPLRLIQDEGLPGALRLVKNILLDAPARRRVLAMRRVFERYRQNISAVFLVARKSPDAAPPP